MNRFGYDPAVKKTLVRNCEKKVRPTARKFVVHDAGSSKVLAQSSGSNVNTRENKLDEPTLCSSEALANYLSDVKITAPPPLTAEDLNDKNICTKVNKKLNFHFNDRIYRNLIELNTNVDDLKKKKKRTASNTTLKRDLEPKIEDFYEETKDNDYAPDIPIIRPKFKPVKKVENGHIHKIVAAFENL